jgi:hypothetical protein
MALDYAALKAEIAVDPANLGYAGKTRGQVVSLLNTPADRLGPPQPWAKDVRYVALPQLLVYAGGTGLFDALIAAAGNVNLTPAQRSAARSALAIFQLQTALDTLDPRVFGTGPSPAGVVDVLATVPGVPATLKADLLALAVVPASRAEALFGPGVVITLDDLFRVM